MSNSNPPTETNRPNAATTTDLLVSHFDEVSTHFEESIAKPSREAVHSFFYPQRQSRQRQEPSPAEETPEDPQADEDQQFVHHFWTTYDDILILSLFTQLGIVFRLGASTWFANFDNVFNSDSPLFVVLPLNCLSCFLMGMLCSGERLMEIIHTRFSPPRLQQMVLAEEIRDRRHNPNEEEEDDEGDGLHIATTTRPTLRRRRPKKQKYFHSWQPPVHLNEDLRDVQLLALERRIRASKCLILFPVRKEDVDVMEHYFADGYRRNSEDDDDLPEPHLASGIYSPQSEADRPEANMSFDLELQECPDSPVRSQRTTMTPPRVPEHPSSQMSNVHLGNANSSTVSGKEKSDTSQPEEAEPTSDDPLGVEQIITDVTANVTENISRLRRVNIADGWDAGTTPEAMSDDIMLGLRDGFCGALSSFSSWNSAMVTFLEQGEIGKAVVGYMLGLQLPIIAYRFGQHIAVYIFVWRCRFETKRDERRGYGIRVAANDQSESAPDDSETETAPPLRHTEDQMPSLRAIITAVFIMALVTQCTSLSFFDDPKNQELALSLLFSPLGVLARWRLSRLNAWRPTFPLGTFTSNMLACALSGGLGNLLAGEPGPLESIVLVSFINGFGGTMSSLASFVVEILAGVDPILMRFDGMIYAFLSIFWAMVIGLLFSTSADWADETATR
jgi:fluoride ion exporter CrcB/FEX